MVGWGDRGGELRVTGCKGRRRRKVERKEREGERKKREKEGLERG